MTTLSRLVLALTLCSLLLAGCQPASVTPTLTSALPAPVSPTATTSPTTTPLPATETPTSEQPILSTVISAGNAPQLKQIAALELPDSKLNTLAFLPNSRTLISGEENGEVAF